MKKKAISMLLVCAMAGTMLTGLGTTVMAEEKKDVTLTVAAITDWVYDIDKQLAEDFEAETGIEIEWQLSTADQYAALLKTKFASQSGPDIFWYWSGANAEQMLPEENFVDFSEEEWVNGFRPAAKAGFTYDGKVMAYNTRAVSQGWGMWYNKKIFEENGVAVPTTFEEFEAACKTFQDNGIRPIYCGMKDEWWTGLWFSQIGPVAEFAHEGFYEKLNNNEVKFAEIPEFVTFMEQFKSLYDNGYLGDDPFSDTWDAALPAVNDNQAAMVMAPDNMWIGNEQFTQDLADFAMFPIPMAGNTYLPMTTGGIGIYGNKNSAHVEEIKEYARFVTREENLKAFYEAEPMFATTPVFECIPEQLDECAKSFAENATGGIGRPLEYYCSYWDNTSVGRYMHEMLMDQKTPVQVLETIDADRTKLFENK